jgi:Lon protease-like protein
MQRPKRIPLFPLDVVLLPEMPLPLHIFEPRYKTMVARCLNENLEFGMILAGNKEVATTGCTAAIIKKLRTYPDGRSDIVTEGRAVFRLTQLLDEKEYYEGVVEYLAEQSAPLDLDREKQLMNTFAQCHQLLFERPWLDPSEDHPITLTYRMAAMLPLEIEKRQALLEMRSERKRRETLCGWMEALLPKLADAQRARKRHALN